MITIYFKHRRLIICSKEEVPSTANERFLLLPSPEYDFGNIPFTMESGTFQNLLVEIPEGMTEKETLDRILSKVKRLNAAGGLVTDPQGNHLMIYRNGVWDLPKGKQEECEDISVTALREVKEESGVDAALGKFLLTTRHSYWMDGELIVKSTYWYSMKAGKDTRTCPQSEEGLEKCEWVTEENLDYRLANTYPSVLDVFEAEKSASNL